MDASALAKLNTPSKVRRKFFKDDGGKDYVEITIIGDPNTLIRKVTTADVAAAPLEWEAYQKGHDEVIVVGTPLTDVPGIDKGLALGLRLKGVRTVEELVGLDEAACKGLGLNIMTFQKAARNLLDAKEYQLKKAMFEEMAERRGPGRPRKEPVEAA